MSNTALLSTKLTEQIATLEGELTAARETIVTLEAEQAEHLETIERLQNSKVVSAAKQAVAEFWKRHPEARKPNRHNAPGIERILQKLLQHEKAGAFDNPERYQVVALPKRLHKAAAIGLLEILRSIMPNTKCPPPTMAIGRATGHDDPFRR